MGETSGLDWDEETTTNIMLVEVPPLVHVVPFTRNQEGGDKRLKDGGAGVGADWLWWWVGHDGTSFGMLVQAKRLKKDKERWTIDFGYKSGKQWEDLHATADVLNVAPSYALYLGSPDYRKPVECGRKDHPSDFGQCDRCIRKSVSFYPSVLAADGVGAEPGVAYRESIPLESIADPQADTETPRTQEWTYGLTPELKEFLTTEAAGVPQAVAKQLVSKARERRSWQFDLMEKNLTDQISEDYVFESLPADQGHLSAPYFIQILRGLRRTPPGYVLNVLNGDAPTGLDTTALAGLVVVRAESFN
ncbi:hypothetical protein Asphe3_41430 (plasmid) [Pseudarthrobacter phenanthrenivorans Sphe3]|uniref:Uncharacterized protein n=1 Tax=Pseudarthrobacter phenanthrenivorans (strain DSM 18606 / JCM 16027 / LMG 23796 / Sphe3) TaxID=930171 RepID=F0MCF7_PSEPM|nr:hypothetical protein Asphe3_41430 [Pseudarthrobacter phenanthrenivorans Sphe3]